MANTLEAAEAKESTVNAIPLILKKNVFKDELKMRKGKMRHFIYMPSQSKCGLLKYDV